MSEPLDYSQYLTSPEAKIIIQKYENRQWVGWQEGENIDDFKKRMNEELTRELRVFPSIFLNFNGKMPLPFRFFRVRPWDKIQNPQLRADFSYPPICYAETGRANLKGYPTFYASNDPITAILEVIKTYKDEQWEGKYFCLSSWLVPGNQKCVLAPFLYDGIHPENEFFSFGKFQAEKFPPEMRENLTAEQMAGLEDIHKFYSRIFQEDNAYAISSYLAHNFLYTDINMPFRADIFIYPSMQTLKRSVNFAIHPNFVDERMTLKAIYRVLVKSITFSKDGMPYSITFSWEEYATNDSGLIVWKKVSPHNQDERDRLNSEDFPTAEMSINISR